MLYSIFPPEELVEGTAVALPLSKSISTRCLVLDALTEGAPDNNASIAVCDDTAVIADALAAWRGVPAGTALTLDMKASGAALRFLTAFFAATPGADVTLTGIPRLLERPMGILVDALRACGAEIDYTGREGFAPLHIVGRQLDGGEVTVDATVSSQFISALLMVAPTMRRNLTINFEGEPVSLPYILMTLGMMEQRGIAAERQPLRVEVSPGAYKPYAQDAEGDWSAAAFWMEICALSAGWYTMTNLRADTLQGDRRAAEYFGHLGVDAVASEEHPGGIDLSPSPEVFGRLDLDLSDNPDLAPALAVTATMIGVPFKLTGLANLGVKECDRLEALCIEMAKLGRPVEKIRDFGLEWDGRSLPVGSMPVLSAHGDHRMAMALAPVSLYIPGILLDGPEYVSKSYPEFWEQLRAVGFRLVEVEIDDEGAVKRIGGDELPAPVE